MSFSLYYLKGAYCFNFTKFQDNEYKRIIKVLVYKIVNVNYNNKVFLF